MPPAPGKTDERACQGNIRIEFRRRGLKPEVEAEEVVEDMDDLDEAEEMETRNLDVRSDGSHVGSPAAATPAPSVASRAPIELADGGFARAAPTLRVRSTKSCAARSTVIACGPD